MKKLRVGFFLIVFILLSLSLVQGQGKSKTAGEVYNSALELFHKGKYQEAIEGFNQLIQSFRQQTGFLLPLYDWAVFAEDGKL